MTERINEHSSSGEGGRLSERSERIKEHSAPGHSSDEGGRLSEPKRTAAIRVPTDEAMRDLGRRVAGVLRAGDLVLLSGPLGAGKTTLTQGLGDGLKVRGPITSPTFVIARVHPSLADGPSLVHADAYRLGGLEEMDDLDLDLQGAVTVVEWGGGIAEGLSDDRLEIVIDRGETEERTVTVTGVGTRWADAAWAGLGDLRS